MEPPNEKKVPIRDIMPNDPVRPMRNNPAPASSRAGFQSSERLAAQAAEFLARKSERAGSPAPDALDLTRAWKPASRFFGSLWKPLAVGVALLVAAGFALNTFSKTVVVITPRATETAVDMALTAGGPGGLAVETVSAEDTESMRAKSSGMEDLSVRATGRILIYNAYSADPQALVRRTRFETADGKVYRLTEAVTVPGAKVVEGKIEPSFIEAGVAADQSGDTYNIGITDFTIPGFKGSAKYEKFYAKSKTPMTGGFVGRTAVVRAEDVLAAKQTLEQNLKNALTARVRERAGPVLLIPESAIAFAIDVASVEPAVGERGDAFDIRISGKAVALAVREQDVTRALKERYGKAVGGAGSEIRNFGELTVRRTAMDDAKKTMALSVSGTARFVWGVPMDELKKGLLSAAGAAGRNAVFASYPQIEEVRVSYRPSWWKIFSRSEDKIIVEESVNP
ncbi:MAG: hypothetical protein HYS44_03940 [Candidatus Niyogibacteria bacterium]|nr:hypothetical protein [Candidatus Niyogibacteria bacterium]